MPPRILLVEDRENLRALLARTLSESFDVSTAGDGETALRILAAEDFAVVVTDVRLPGADGNAVLAAARRKDPSPEVVLMTAFAAVPNAVAALKAGAYDYLAKPFEPADLARVVARAAERHALVSRTRQLEAALDSRESGLLGRSEAIARVRRVIERLGPLPVPVLLTGESGTGKEVAARELHRLRGRGPFVGVNCGAIPAELLEAELFGVARGAYTGAIGDRPGLFEAAEGGTLFLDEIGDLALPLQVKLNRALEEGEIRRVGATAARAADVRLIAATHRDLARMVAEGTFRSDLYFRLKVVQISLPPLRERIEDIPLLAARFLQLAQVRLGARAARIAPETLAALESWVWPGNVRELRHTIEHAAVMSEEDTVLPDHLPPELRGARGPVASGTYRAAIERAQDVAGRAYLVGLLQRTGGNVSRAAEAAGMERESLHRLLRRHGIDASRFRP
ncbi:MAG: sigma-54-dependent transcriptional regulator [Myxococcota bacterium]